MSNYLEGLWLKSRRLKLGVDITDIRPGFVQTDLLGEGRKLPWVASVDKAVDQIERAIQRRKKSAWITRRWGLVAWVARRVPAAWVAR
jgi:short-subunit dehydrogenase